MKQHFVVYWTKEGTFYNQGHSRGGFTDYAEAFRWAMSKVMDGYIWKIKQEVVPCPNPKPQSVPKNSKQAPPFMMLCLHTKLRWQHKQYQ